MKPESTRYLELLEQRLALLGALAKGLAESRGDFVSMDLPGIERRIAEQVRFCSQIRALDSEITSVQIRCAEHAGVPPCTSAISWPLAGSGAREEDAAQLERIRLAMTRLAAAQAEVKRLNDAHLALLRRSRHTVHVLLNLFKSYEPTYSAPPVSVGAAMYEERV